MRISDWSSDGCSSDLAAFLLGGELVLEMDPGGARLDIGLHDLEAVQRAAEARLGIGDDRNEPVASSAAFHMLDLVRSEEHTSELQSLMRISYAVFCLKKKTKTTTKNNTARDVR